LEYKGVCRFAGRVERLISLPANKAALKEGKMAYNGLNMWRLVLRLRQADIYLLLADWCGKFSTNFNK